LPARYANTCGAHESAWGVADDTERKVPSTVSTPIRVGLIGAVSGQTWAARAHLPALLAMPDMEVVAVATTRPESAREAARLTGAKHAFTDGRALAQHPDVEVVAVVVRVPAHHELVAAAIEAGKHVFCEWPLDTNLDGARQLRDEAHRAGIVHMIGLQGRQSVELNSVRDLVAEGLIGRVLSVDLRHTTGHRGGAFVPTNAVWGLDRSQGRNLLTIQGGHSLDALRVVLDCEFDWVSALVTTRTPRATVVETGEIVSVSSPDQVVVAGELGGGISAAAHLQGGAPELQGFCLEIHGDGGVLQISGAGAHNSDLRIRSVVHNVEVVHDITEPSDSVPVPRGLANPALNVAKQYASLSEQIRTGQTTGPSFSDAVAVHELLDAIQRASDTGCRQYVKSAVDGNRTNR
jgi:predicted dehydrogenase